MTRKRGRPRKHDRITVASLYKRKYVRSGKYKGRHAARLFKKLPGNV